MTYTWDIRWTTKGPRLFVKWPRAATTKWPRAATTTLSWLIGAACGRTWHRYVTISPLYQLKFIMVAESSSATYPSVSPVAGLTLNTEALRTSWSWWQGKCDNKDKQFCALSILKTNAVYKEWIMEKWYLRTNSFFIKFIYHSDIYTCNCVTL